MRVLVVPAPSIAEDMDHIVGSLGRAGLQVTVGAASDLGGDGASDYDLVAGPGTLPCDAGLFDRCPSLKGLISVGAGCEGFDRAAAEARGIRIATGAGGSSAGDMASAAILLILALSHDLIGAQTALRDGRRRNLAGVTSLDGRVVGLVGYGAIGREVSRRLRAWNVEVLVASPSLPPGRLGDGALSIGLDRLLRSSDVVSLHAALTPASRNLLDRRRIGAMKTGALLVNTARGALVDEAALIEALHSGALGGAALDCFLTEPLPPDHPLRTAPNVILTPHQIGHTAAGQEALVRTFIDNIVGMSKACAGAPHEGSR